jgi:hypothetical protein
MKHLPRQLLVCTILFGASAAAGADMPIGGTPEGSLPPRHRSTQSGRPHNSPVRAGVIGTHRNRAISIGSGRARSFRIVFLHLFPLMLQAFFTVTAECQTPRGGIPDAPQAAARSSPNVSQKVIAIEAQTPPGGEQDKPALDAENASTRPGNNRPSEAPKNADPK